MSKPRAIAGIGILAWAAANTVASAASVSAAASPYAAGAASLFPPPPAPALLGNTGPRPTLLGTSAMLAGEVNRGVHCLAPTDAVDAELCPASIARGPGLSRPNHPDVADTSAMVLLLNANVAGQADQHNTPAGRNADVALNPGDGEAGTATGLDIPQLPPSPDHDSLETHMLSELAAWTVLIATFAVASGVARRWRSPRVMA